MPDKEITPSVFATNLNRRDALKVAGASAAVAAIAPASLLDTASAATKVREFHAAWPYVAPPQGHFNEYSSDGNVINLSIYDDLLQMPLAKYVWATGAWVPLMAVSWKVVAPATFIIKLRKGAVWSDGLQFNAQDVMTSFNIRRLLSYSVWSYIDGMTAPDPYTVVFHMKKPSSVVQRYVLEANITADSVYSKFGRQVEALVKAGKDVATSQEGKDLRMQLDQYRPMAMVVSGPFMFDPMTPITSGQLTLVKNPTSWCAKQVKFDKIVDFNGETPVITPIVLQKQVDYATQGFPVATTLQFIKEGIHILRPPIYSGPALFINFKKVPEMVNKVVRQAIAYAVDRDQNATVSLGQSAKRCAYMAGFSDNIAPLWISKSNLAQMNGYTYNQAKATSLLMGAGFKKGSDGTWMTPSGKAMSYTLEFPAEFADWSAAAANLAEQLTAFGIKITQKAVTYTQEPLDVNHGNFELAIQAWGSGSPFPQFSFAADILTHNPPVAEGPGTGLNFMQNGANLQDLVTASGAGLDVNTQKAGVTRMSMIFNDLLPIIPLWERYGNNVALKGVRVAGWPADSDPIYKNDPYSDSFVTMMIISGQLYGV